MIRYCTESIFEKGFLLELRVSGDIISAKALLVTQCEDICIDIFSFPLVNEQRVISVPQWNFSYIYYPPAEKETFMSSLNDNLNVLIFADIFILTVNVIHDLIDSSPHRLSNENYVEGNDISDADCIFSFSTNYYYQVLPF